MQPPGSSVGNPREITPNASACLPGGPCRGEKPTKSGRIRLLKSSIGRQTGGVNPARTAGGNSRIAKNPLIYLDFIGAGGGTRTRTDLSVQRILSPLCLPLSPPRLPGGVCVCLSTNEDVVEEGAAPDASAGILTPGDKTIRLTKWFRRVAWGFGPSRLKLPRKDAEIS